MEPKILLVDDDPNILSAYTRNLRKRFQFDTAQGGAEALGAIRAKGPYAVILSDMRMPGMDGIQLLAEARTLAPDSVRIMLTGNADQETAIEAVNRGNIFRFLTKPCEPDALAVALEAGIKQYALVTAEKELVEGTLKGSIDLLAELMSIADPDTFSRSQRLEPLTRKIAQVMELEAPWVLSVASRLCLIGALTLPDGILAKARKGDPITAREHEAMARLPEIGSNLLKRIPRMEGVASAILFMNKNFNGSGFPPLQAKEEGIPLAARILKVASDYLDQVDKRQKPRAVLEDMRQKSLFYDPRVVNALELALDVPDEVLAAPEVAVEANHETAQVGQVLVDGVYTREGLLLYPPNTVLGHSHLERMANFARLVGLREPFLVR